MVVNCTVYTICIIVIVKRCKFHSIMIVQGITLNLKQNGNIYFLYTEELNEMEVLGKFYLSHSFFMQTQIHLNKLIRKILTFTGI